MDILTANDSNVISSAVVSMDHGHSADSSCETKSKGSATQSFNPILQSDAQQECEYCVGVTA